MIRDTIYGWVDAILSPMHSFLDLSLEQLREARAVTAQGLNFGQYLGVFGDLPTSWQLVLSSLLISCGVIGGLFLFRAFMRVYYSKKDAIKWW